jgi:diacylglycerol kinase family enzyme
LADEIGVPRRPREIARMIAKGQTRTVHLGVVNGTHFAMMAGIGFDARVVAAVPMPVKRWFGKAAFVAAALLGAFRYSLGNYTVTVDGRSYTASSVVVANGHFYGGRFSCAPLARLEDPLLYACLFLKTGPLRALRYGLWLLLGRLHRLDDVTIVPGERVTVEGRIGEPVQVDGDIVTRAPATVWVAGTALNLVMPDPISSPPTD